MTRRFTACFILNLFNGYDNYFFVLLHQKQASGLTEPLLIKWGITIRERGAVEINPCRVTEHGEHEHLLLFYKDNRQLLAHYKTTMDGTDDRKKEAIQADFDLLKDIEAAVLMLTPNSTDTHFARTTEKQTGQRDYIIQSKIGCAVT